MNKYDYLVVWMNNLYIRLFLFCEHKIARLDETQMLD